MLGLEGRDLGFGGENREGGGGQGKKLGKKKHGILGGDVTERGQSKQLALARKKGGMQGGKNSGKVMVGCEKREQ